MQKISFTDKFIVTLTLMKNLEPNACKRINEALIACRFSFEAKEKGDVIEWEIVAEMQTVGLIHSTISRILNH